MKLITEIFIVACNVQLTFAKRHDRKRHHRVLVAAKSGRPNYFEGDLGSLPSIGSISDKGYKEQALNELQSFLDANFGSDKRQSVSPTNHKLFTDASGSSHIRFQQSIDNMKVEGTSLVMHVDPDGTVKAVNGDYILASDLETSVNLDCDPAMVIALEQRGIVNYTWLTECDMAVVLGFDGFGHKVWKRMVGYDVGDRPPQRDILFASIQNGDLVAYHPQVFGARSLQTYDCEQGNNCTKLVGSSSDRIKTGDRAIDAAHNNAIATYDFYWKHFGRDSVDDKGFTLVSQVHYNKGYTNAFWDGSRITYGDGDGLLYLPLSLGVDIAAHELTHGVTQSSSGLIYSGESGAINEAMSDIMGACVNRQEGASEDEVWLVGASVYTPNTPGDFLRNMRDPASGGNYDYYPTRYTGSSDNGGVHWNSGIMNLAFSLMVTGGSHPRGKTTIVVPAIDADFDTSLLEAARIFYEANTGCLTPSSTFHAARQCTVAQAGNFAPSVRAAWDAVGVFEEVLSPGVGVIGISAEVNVVRAYRLPNVDGGAVVTCTLTGVSGNADLFVKLGSEPVAEKSSTLNDCVSAGGDSHELCSTPPAESDSVAFVAILASQAFANVTLTCSVSFKLVDLEDNVAINGTSGSVGTVRTYVLAGVKPNEYVTCDLFGGYDTSSDTLGDADLFVRFGVEAVSEPGSDANDCESTGGTSKEECATGVAEVETSAFVAVTSFRAYSGLSVRCRRRVVQDLMNGKSVDSLSAAENQMRFYRLLGVQKGEDVRCELRCNTTDGDADLLVRFNRPPTTSSFDCESDSFSSNESCTALSAPSDYSSVFAGILAYQAYRDLSITCTRVGVAPEEFQPTLASTFPPTISKTLNPTNFPRLSPFDSPTFIPSETPMAKPTRRPASDHPSSVPSITNPSHQYSAATQEFSVTGGLVATEDVPVSDETIRKPSPVQLHSPQNVLLFDDPPVRKVQSRPPTKKPR